MWTLPFLTLPSTPAGACDTVTEIPLLFSGGRLHSRLASFCFLTFYFLPPPLQVFHPLRLRLLQASVLPQIATIKPFPFSKSKRDN